MDSSRHSIHVRYVNADYYVCDLCDRVAQLEGFNCEFCEYDLCTTCSVIYCTAGHTIKMWTVPDAMNITCYVCDTKNITADCGCSICKDCLRVDLLEGM